MTRHLCKIALIPCFVIHLLPIGIVLLTAFKTPLELLNDKGLFSLRGLTMENFVTVIVADQFLTHLLTSTRIALSSTLLSLIFGALTAYGLCMFKLKGREFLSLSILIFRLLPPVILALPIFLILRKLQWVDTEWGLILAHTTFNLPFAIWLLLPFFAQIPIEINQAAQLDGLGPLQTFRLIHLPLVLPGLIVSALFCFLLSWNDFLFSLVLAGSKTKTAPLIVNSYMSAEQIEWGPMTAAATLIMLPVFLFSLVLQKHLINDGAVGAVKG